MMPYLACREYFFGASERVRRARLQKARRRGFSCFSWKRTPRVAAARRATPRPPCPGAARQVAEIERSSRSESAARRALALDRSCRPTKRSGAIFGKQRACCLEWSERLDWWPPNRLTSVSPPFSSVQEAANRVKALFNPAASPQRCQHTQERL